jgi:hypothetical protein
MQVKTISFNKTGYDPFLDFIKAWAIICVIFGHTFPYLNQVGYSIWIGIQVPLFILIQNFHSYKKALPKINIIKIFSRVLLPFLIFELVVFAIALCLGGGGILKTLLIDGIKKGGYGPGAYYPWIYFQMAILLPLIYSTLKKIPENALLWVFLIICEGCEIICSIVDFPDWIYRLLAIRYFFLIYLTMLWIKKGIVPDRKMLLLSLLSLATIVYFRYFSVNDEPWFYNTAWKTHRWLCYYYVANLYVYMLYLLWIAIKKYSFVSKCVKKIAASTYEIFLVQMSVIYLFHADSLSIVPNGKLQFILWFVVVWVASIGLGIKINELRLKKIS